MTDKESECYVRGSRWAWLRMLKECIRQLGYDTPEGSTAKWIAEREEIVLHLRGVCRDYGDNEWDERLHLADVIDKHLRPHLDRPRSRGGSPSGDS